MKYKVYLHSENFWRSDEHIRWYNKEYDTFPLICEVEVKDNNYLFRNLINKDGKYYAINQCTTDEPYVAGANEVNIISFNEKSSYCDSKPTCPICGTEQEDDFEFSDKEEHTCYMCGAKLLITRNIEVTYDTEVISKPKIRRIK